MKNKLGFALYRKYYIQAYPSLATFVHQEIHPSFICKSTKNVSTLSSLYRDVSTFKNNGIMKILNCGYISISSVEMNSHFH